MSQNTLETKRLFIGGLFNGATPEDLRERFVKYGDVKAVDMKVKKNDIGEVINTFAYVNFDSTPAKLKQFMDVFNKTKWKGKELKVQFAEASFIDRLERERKSVVKTWSPVKTKTETDVNPHQAIRELKVKGPPGTAVEGKEGWVVGKYSQIVPVLRVKTDGGRKTVIFDPSKNCHALKRFGDDDDDNVPEINIDQLTWRLKEKEVAFQVKNQKISKQKLKKKKKKKPLDTDSDDDDMESDDDDDDDDDDTERSHHKSHRSKDTPLKINDDSSKSSSSAEEIGRNIQRRKPLAQSKSITLLVASSNQGHKQKISSSTLKNKIDHADDLDESPERANDSDNESDDSRGSCDTDEIVRRSKSRVNSKRKNVLANLKPVPPLSPLGAASKRKLGPVSDDVTKKLVFSEFDDGLVISTDDEKESEDVKYLPEDSSEDSPEEDLLELISSGKMEGMLADLFKKNAQKLSKATIGDAAKKSSDAGIVSKGSNGTKSTETKKRKRKEPEVSNHAVGDAVKKSPDIKSVEKRKRKQAEPEVSKKKKRRIESPEDKQVSSTAGKAKTDSRVSKKRKRSQLEDEEESKTNTQDILSKSQPENVSPGLKVSLNDEIPKKRKKIASTKDNTRSQNNKQLESKESEDDHLKSDCVKEKKKADSIKMKKPELSAKKSTPVESAKSWTSPGVVTESPKKIPSQVNSLGFKDFQSFRYDPSAVDHEQFEIKDFEDQKKTAQFSPAKKEKVMKSGKSATKDETIKESPVTTKNATKKANKLTKADEENIIKDESTKPSMKKSEKLNAQRFSEVDASVVDAFKESSDDAPFSLGALFGSADEEFLEEEIETKPVTGNWKKKVKVVVEENSDDDLEQETESKSKVSKKSQKKVEGGFFYRPNDSRLKESKFYCDKDIGELRSEWQERRPQLVEAYRMKKKKPYRAFGKAPRPEGRKSQSQGKAFNKKGNFRRQ